MRVSSGAPPPSRCRAHRARGGFLPPAWGRRVCARRRAVGTANSPVTGRFSRQDESSGGIGKVLWSTELPVREWTGPDSNRRPPAYEAITEALGLVLLSQNCFSP
jgi:hypothetical protein